MSVLLTSVGKVFIDCCERNILDRLMKSKALLKNLSLHLYLGGERFLVIVGSIKKF